MRVRGADEGDGQRVGAQVVEEAALPGEQARVLLALDALAEQPRRHRPSSSAISSAALWTDLTMFW
ncbi:hypothetical protein GCM10020219_077150 [Nonomuraea dietziae]